MSTVKIQSNASGTGAFTIASPNSNTDRTLTLPDATGTFNISGAVNEVPAGSVGAPSITTTGDTNTGIFFPAADTIAFSEGGVEAMRLDSSGNVGIGTNSPGTKLDVSGNLRFSAASPVIEFNNGGAQVYSTVANTLQFASGGGIGSPTERMRIASTGAIAFNGASNYGTSGQVLTSNGNAPPTWSAAAGGGVTSITGTASQITASASTGAVTLSLPATINVNTSGNAATATTATNQSGGTVSATTGSFSGLITGANATVADINNANDAGSFSCRGNASFPASMSFHRTGVYAINMGLSTGNNFIIGGWSASANAFSMTGAGALTMLNNITAYSDERVKTNWRDLQPDFIERLAEVKHGVYDRTDQVSTQVGVGAQSLRPLMEHAVMENENGELSVAYGNAALVSAVQLAKRVVEQDARIAKLEAIVAQLTKGNTP